MNCLSFCCDVLWWQRVIACYNEGGITIGCQLGLFGSFLMLALGHDRFLHESQSNAIIGVIFSIILFQDICPRFKFS